MTSVASAEISDNKVKIGLLTDMSATYSDVSGQGTVVDWHDGTGHVRLEGEIWAARGPHDLASDTPVTVAARDGLVLVVAPQPPGG